MKRIFSCSAPLICLLLLFLSCAKNDNTSSVDGDGNPANSNGFISAKFNGKLKQFKFRADGAFEDNNKLLGMNGFMEDNSLSPTLEIHIKKTEGKITTGTYHLYDSPDIAISATYTISRKEDGALLSNTFYETRDIGNKKDLIINIKSLANGRAKGTFNGVITTDNEVKGDQVITLTEGTFDVALN
ncbi:MAG: hypothetical protein ABIP95_15180 [Pelobium sp.]